MRGALAQAPKRVNAAAQHGAVGYDVIRDMMTGFPDKM